MKDADDIIQIITKIVRITIPPNTITAAHGNPPIGADSCGTRRANINLKGRRARAVGVEDLNAGGVRAVMINRNNPPIRIDGNIAQSDKSTSATAIRAECNAVKGIRSVRIWSEDLDTPQGSVTHDDPAIRPDGDMDG